MKSHTCHNIAKYFSFEQKIKEELNFNLFDNSSNLPMLYSRNSLTILEILLVLPHSIKFYTIIYLNT
jgi:hypothetical protein